MLFRYPKPQKLSYVWGMMSLEVVLFFSSINGWMEPLHLQSGTKNSQKCCKGEMKVKWSALKVLDVP